MNKWCSGEVKAMAQNLKSLGLIPSGPVALVGLVILDTPSLPPLLVVIQQDSEKLVSSVSCETYQLRLRRETCLRSSAESMIILASVHSGGYPL